jgi:hypothetical protein
MAAKLGEFRLLGYALHRLTVEVTKFSGVFISKRQNEILFVVFSL